MDCARCHMVAPANARFCPSCGARLAFARTPLADVSQVADTARGDAGGERKHVTVLFADTAASMDVLTRHDPEEAAEVFDHVLAQMTEAVHRYEGTVNQVLGDGIMAVFGAPVAHEDHAIRACYGALWMQESVNALGDRWQRTHGVPVQIRIGLDSGEVVLRSADDGHQNLSVVGQTVHVASRMEQLAKPGTILTTPQTAELVRDRVRMQALGPMAVRGLAEPLDVYQVLGVGAAPEVRQGLERQAPFVGRRRELGRLTEILGEVGAGAGRLVGVGGEPGIGKSRLLDEFLRTARASGASVHVARALPYTRSIGHRAGMEIVRDYFGIAATDDRPEIRAKVVDRMRALDLDDDIAAMLWQLDALEEGSAFWNLDWSVRRRRAFRANWAVIRTEGRRRPFIMVVENLPWADADVTDSLALVISQIPRGVFVIVSYRPGYDHGWIAGHGVEHLHLDPLSPDEVQGLLDALLGTDPGLASLKQLLAERTGGNPLFVEESVRDLVQRGRLAGEPGAYALAHPVSDVDVPASIRSVLEARIDRLSGDDKRLLQSAAVVGDRADLSVLRGVMQSPAPALRASLARLREAEFLDERAAYPEPVYAFRHALTHDVAYGSLLQDRRRQLHARVVTALEELHGPAPVEVVEQLANHAFQGEVWDKAARYLPLAASKVRRIGGRETMFLRQALVALSHLPREHEHLQAGIDIREHLCEALVPLGQHPQMLSLLSESESLARALGDDLRLGRTLALRCTAYWELGRSADAIETGQQSVAIAEQLGDPDLHAMAGASLGGALRAVGEFRRTVSLLESTLAQIGAKGSPDIPFGRIHVFRGLSLAHLAWSLAELGEFAAARRYAEEALVAAERGRHAYSLALAHLALGGTLLRQGQMHEGMTVLERGVDLTRDAPFLYPPMAADLGVIYVLTGRPAHAIELASTAVERAEQMERLGRLSLIVTHLSEVYFLTGRHEEAAAQARRAFHLAVERGEIANRVYAHRILGVLAAEASPPRFDEARAELSQALSIARERGMRPLAARCHLALGRIARRRGDHEAAGPHLAVAEDMFREMDMRYWLDRLSLDLVSPTPPF